MSRDLTLMPDIAETLYTIAREGNPKVEVRIHPCVVCGAKEGEPCTFPEGLVSIHGNRRVEVKAK